MKSSRLLKVFEDYIKKLDMNNAYAKAKYFHSLKSMDLARNIAQELGVFNDEEVVIIELIALFHDIGNFSEKDHDYLDNDGNDFTMRSIGILFDDGLIRKITKDTHYDNLIKLAIFCHNKDGLPKNIDEKTICVCNIMKDVYRLEELHMAINSPSIDNRIKEYPTTMVYDTFKAFKEIKSDISDNNADNVLIVLSKLFNLNYKVSYAIVMEKGFVEKIIDSLIFEDKKLEKFFKQIEAVLTKYTQKKVN